MLPTPANAFVGRRDDLRRLERAVRTPGVVTLIGPPGAGKTRLAVQVAGTFRGEVRFVDLTRARSLAEVVLAVAGVLRVQLSGAESGWVEQIGAALEPGLVILDNCEQAAQSVRVAVDAWSTRGATILATSRIRLDAATERVVELGALSEADGTTLLLTRAREAGIAVAEDDAARALVNALDALPLAIEIVAVRCRVLSTTRVRERLSGDGLHGVDEAIATSWELASRAARATLAQLAVFRGAFDLEAAEGVVRLGSGTVLDAVDELVRSSLVGRSSDGTTVRFRLLESVRAFALDRGSQDEVEDRHFRYFDDRYGRRDDTDDPRWTDELAVALDDLRASHEYALDRDPDAATRLALSLRPLALNRGPYGLLVPLLDAALARTRSVRLRATAMRIRTMARAALGELDGLLEDVRVASDLARQSGDVRCEGMLILLEGQIMSDMGSREQALERYRTGAAFAERVGEPRVRANALGALGGLLLTIDNPAAARAYEEAAELHRRYGPIEGEANALVGLAYVQDIQGDSRGARATLDEAIAVLRDQGRSSTLGRGLEARGYLLLSTGHLGPAETDLRDALEVYRALGARRSLAGVLRKLGLVALHSGDARRAEVLVREALAWDAKTGRRRSAAWSLLILGLVFLASGRRADAAEPWRAAVEKLRATGIADPTAAIAMCAIAETGHEAALEETRRQFGDTVDAVTLATLALASGVVARRNGEPWEAHLAFARAQAPFSAELRLLLRAVEDSPGTRLIARWDSVQVHRPGLPPTTLSGVSARIVSELVTVDAPVGWDAVAREIWRDGAEERVLRKRWDAALARLRRQLADLGLRPDLVRVDGHGHVELVLADGETADDET